MYLKLGIPQTKRKMTLNEAYTKGYRVRMSWKKHWEREIKKVAEHIKKLDETKRYYVVARFHFDKRIPDSGNCSPMTKMIVDILVKDYGILPDDKPQYVASEYNESVYEGRKDNTLDLFFIEVGNDGTGVNEGFSITVPKVPDFETSIFS